MRVVPAARGVARRVRWRVACHRAQVVVMLVNFTLGVLLMIVSFVLSLLPSTSTWNYYLKVASG